MSAGIFDPAIFDPEIFDTGESSGVVPSRRRGRQRYARDQQRRDRDQRRRDDALYAIVLQYLEWKVTPYHDEPPHRIV